MSNKKGESLKHKRERVSTHVFEDGVGGLGRGENELFDLLKLVHAEDAPDVAAAGARLLAKARRIAERERERERERDECVRASGDIEATSTHPAYLSGNALSSIHSFW